MRRNVVFSESATDDLISIYDHVAEADANRALAYVERIRSYCSGLADFPERGTRREDIRPNLRVIGFERRIVIAFAVTAQSVTIYRILYGGRDLGRAFRTD